MEHTVYIDEWLCQTERWREIERGERQTEESCFVYPRQECFIIRVQKGYFQETGEARVWYQSRLPGINHELLHLNEKSFIFSLRFVVNAEKKIIRCVSIYVIG